MEENNLDRFIKKFHPCEEGKKWILSEKQIHHITDINQIWLYESLRHDWRLWLFMKGVELSIFINFVMDCIESYPNCKKLERVKKFCESVKNKLTQREAIEGLWICNEILRLKWIENYTSINSNNYIISMKECLIKLKENEKEQKNKMFSILPSFNF